MNDPDVKKVLKKIFLTIIILGALLFGAGGLILTFYEDELIAHVVREANKSLNTPVSVGDIEMSLWHHFPRVSFRFNNIEIKDSFPGNDSTLIKAEAIDLSFNPAQALWGDLIVDNVYMKNGVVHLRMDRQGDINYVIFKTPEDSTASREKVGLELQNISLDQVRFKYTNDYRNLNLNFFTPAMEASVINEGTRYDVEAKGEVGIDYIENAGKMYSWEVPVNVMANLHYDDSLKSIKIDPSVLTILTSDFNVSGSYSFLKSSSIDLSVNSESTNVETLLAMLQQKDALSLKDYSSKGRVYLSLDMKGEWKEKSGPGLKVSFGLEDAAVKHNPSSITIENTHLKGLFETSDFTNRASYLLHLEDVKGSLGGYPFTGHLKYKNPDILTFPLPLKVHWMLNEYWDFSL